MRSLVIFFFFCSENYCNWNFIKKDIYLSKKHAFWLFLPTTEVLSRPGAAGAGCTYLKIFFLSPLIPMSSLLIFFAQKIILNMFFKKNSTPPQMVIFFFWGGGGKKPKFFVNRQCF